MVEGSQNTDVLESYTYHPVVTFDPSKDKIAKLDLSAANKRFKSTVYNNMDLFRSFIDNERRSAGAKFLTGGYKEVREMYRRSELFVETEEPRSLHLGIDIWGDEGTEIFTPLDGRVHSFRFNDNHGDYGATIILEHSIGTFTFYILYGHLALRDIKNLAPSQFFKKGDLLAHFGNEKENGNWPPHLHFQIILDIGEWQGDYPGVCRLSEADAYLKNSPDPSVILNLD